MMVMTAAATARASILLEATMMVATSGGASQTLHCSPGSPLFSPPY